MSNAIKKFFTPRKLCAMAMLIALEIVLARFVGWQISEGLRISFETIPILIGGLWLGPVAGLLIGWISDILGTVLSGYGVYFLPLSITPILNGVLPWLIFHFIWKDNVNPVKCVITIIVTELFASFVCGTYALTWYYKLFVPSKVTTFWLLTLTRLVKLLTIACDTVLVTLLHFSAYKRAIKPMLDKR